MSVEIDTRGVGISVIMDGGWELVKIVLEGKLHHEDYEVLIPVIERAIEAAGEHKPDILVDMRRFEGWTFEAALDDLKFGLRIRHAFHRMAIVGEKKWEEISVELFRHFCSGEMQFFEDYDAAMAWLRS
ncbi:STAS/SEC14 domain-containing protein [Nitratifractor sp.]|uniref:STAS/SEC14 domain-containing protein n=1 Tax=Nitratifractor sp. TaxID=2268144 RepID=UPI0025F95F29|nr:STAS/SEC14 domain-containing protein [Nitratifractor sp.]